MPGLFGVLTPPSAQLAFWTILFWNSPEQSVFVAHDDNDFLMLLWPDSVYLSIEIPVRKPLKSHETAVKRLLNGVCCRLGGVARVKNTETLSWKDNIVELRRTGADICVGTVERLAAGPEEHTAQN